MERERRLCRQKGGRMKHKILSIVYLLCTTVSSLSAEASETSEERQRDTFTLYDRNRREVNWQRQQRQQRQARHSIEARDRYHRNPADYSQQNTRGSNSFASQDRVYTQQRWNGPINQERYYYSQQPPRTSYPNNRVNRGYYHTDVYEYGDVRTNPNYSLVPAVPPIE